jgi:hypothetical protein
MTPGQDDAAMIDLGGRRAGFGDSRQSCPLQ